MQTNATKCDVYAKCVMHLKSLITNVIMAFNAFHGILSKLFTSRVSYITNVLNTRTQMKITGI